MCVLIPLDFAAISSRLILVDVRRFASSGEIQSYLSHVVDHFDLAHHIEFKTTVTRSAWSEQESKWLVNTECNGIVNKGRKADVLINAAGILNHYRYPDIHGLDSYRGRLIYTADWDHSVDLAGKRVNVIGAGASAVQVIPQIQPLVKQLSVYIWTPSWITSLPDSFEESTTTPTILQTTSNAARASRATITSSFLYSTETRTHRHKSAKSLNCG